MLGSGDDLIEVKTTRNLSQYSRSPGQDLNLGPLKYKAGVLNHLTVTFGNTGKTLSCVTEGR